MSRFLVLALLVMLTLFISILVAQFVTTGQRAAIGLVLDVAGLTFIGLPFFRRLRVFHSLAFSGSVSDWPRAHERAALGDDEVADFVAAGTVLAVAGFFFQWAALA